MLYRLLILESLSAAELDGHDERIGHARQREAAEQLEQLETERQRWLKVSDLLREASALAQGAACGERLPERLHPEAGEMLPDDVLAFAASRGYRTPEDVPGRHIDIVELPATFVMNWIADDAEKLAAGHSQPYWNEIARAQAASEQSTKATTWRTRARLMFLRDQLKRADSWWTIPQLTELVLASQTDWEPPPVVLASAIVKGISGKHARSGYDVLKSKIENLLNPRSSRAR